MNFFGLVPRAPVTKQRTRSAWQWIRGGIHWLDVDGIDMALVGLDWIRQSDIATTPRLLQIIAVQCTQVQCQLNMARVFVPVAEWSLIATVCWRCDCQWGPANKWQGTCRVDVECGEISPKGPRGNQGIDSSHVQFQDFVTNWCTTAETTGVSCPSSGTSRHPRMTRMRGRLQLCFNLWIMN